MGKLHGEINKETGALQHTQHTRPNFRHPSTQWIPHPHVLRYPVLWMGRGRHQRMGFTDDSKRSSFPPASPQTCQVSESLWVVGCNLWCKDFYNTYLSPLKASVARCCMPPTSCWPSPTWWQRQLLCAPQLRLLSTYLHDKSTEIVALMLLLLGTCHCSILSCSCEVLSLYYSHGSQSELKRFNTSQGGANVPTDMMDNDVSNLYENLQF